MQVRRKPMTIIGKPMRQGLKKPLSKVLLTNLFEHSLHSATGHWVLAPSRGKTWNSFLGVIVSSAAPQSLPFRYRGKKTSPAILEEV